MFRGLALVAPAVLVPGLVLAGPLDDFVAARKANKIAGLSTYGDLMSIYSPSVLELSGTVSGSMRGQEGRALLIVKIGESSFIVDAESVPYWVSVGEPRGRMIVKAVPNEASTQPSLSLVASIVEADAIILDERIREAAERKAAIEREKQKSKDQDIDIGEFIPSITGKIGGTASSASSKIVALVPEYMAVVMEKNKGLATPQARLIAECVLAYSSQYGVDARLVMALIQHESGFDPMSTSSVGAQGLGQLMPETSRSLGIANPYDIEANVYGTVRTLRGHLDRQGTESDSTYEQLARALAAYNAGSGAVRKFGGVPPYRETQAYIERVISTYKKLAGA